jgi:hypothetical protein
VLAEDGVPLHVEIDERSADRTGRCVERPDDRAHHGYALTLDSWHYQRLALRGGHRLVLWDSAVTAGPAPARRVPRRSTRSARTWEQVLEAVAPEGRWCCSGTRWAA